MPRQRPTPLRVTSPSPSEADAVLAALAAEPGGVSLPRLCKRLGLRMSVLLRTLAWLGEDAIGGVPGPGWVRVMRDGERDIAVLTEAGRSRVASATAPPD
jgi:hypothetical protein